MPVKATNRLKYLDYIWLLPIIYSVAVVVIFGVNVIHWDEWDLVGLYERIEQNGFLNISTIKHLFAQHNEHRIFFPVIIMLISHKITHFNVTVCMLITQLMAIAVYAGCIRYLYSQTNSKSYLMEKIFILLLGIICLSSIQNENFLWGFQVAFYMAIFAAAVSLYYFHAYCAGGSVKHGILSLLLGIIASFSSLHGLFVWPVIVIIALICLISGDRSTLKKVIPYIPIGIICFMVYFYGWKRPTQHPDLSRNVYLIVKFFLGSIGGVYTGKYSRLTVLLGGATALVSALLVLIFFRQKKINAILFPIGLIGFGYAALLSIAVGRSGFSIGWSTSSRYMSFSLLSLLGTVMIIYQFLIAEDNKNQKKLKVVVMCVVSLFSLLILFGNLKGFYRTVKYDSPSKKENVIILQNYEDQPLEQLRRVYPWSTYDRAHDMIGRLKERRLNVFSNAP